jgi:hypothetical protein
MSADDLVNRLNGYPRWVFLEPQTRADAHRTISELTELFQHACFEDRKAITSALSEPAKYVMATFTEAKALDGRRTGSRDTILQGLIPVVIAGGNPCTRTGGMLCSLILNSALKTHVDAAELFEYAARLATDEAAARRLRAFPGWPAPQRDIERWGFHEQPTPDGVIYEHLVESHGGHWYDKLLGRRKSRLETRIGILKGWDRFEGRDVKDD